METYYSKNKEVVLSKVKNYNEENKEKKRQYNLEQKRTCPKCEKIFSMSGYSRHKNKKINCLSLPCEIKGKEKMTCECGGKYTFHNNKKHLETKKHQLYLETKQTNIE